MANYDSEDLQSGAPEPRPRKSQSKSQRQSKSKSKRRRRHPALTALSIFLKVIGTLLLIGICTGALVACFAVVYVQNVIIPQAGLELTAYEISQSSIMYYVDKNTGEEVEMVTLFQEDSQWVKYADIPKNLINATIAIEDRRFLTHPGVDWRRTAGAIYYMFTGQDIQGGSTITQQLIKNVTGDNETTVKRKVMEIFRALEYDKNHSKDEIIEWYLNFIYLGDGCRGVYTAAKNYFGKEVQDLTLAECASLIAITNNPSIYNPYSTREITRTIDGEQVTKTGTEWNLYRRDLILAQMLDQEMITEAEYKAAKAEPLNLKREEGTPREQAIYTWYEDQVIKEVTEALKEKDYNDAYINYILYNGGLRIETCFDPEVQAYVDAVYQDREGLVLDSASGQQIQSAITVVHNATGNVVALAGGIGEKTGNRLFNRASDTIRPPGSSINPLAVYAPAMEMNQLTPATVIDDSPINLNGDAWPSNAYNYYKGLTTIHEALEDSVNTIAVKVLKDRVTPNVAYQYLTERFGITSLVASREVKGEIKSDILLAPLALGGLTDGVSTYEMAAAYATFANNGIYKTPRTYVRVTDMNGNVLLENETVSQTILKESTVYYMNVMLQNVVKAGTGTTANFSGMTIAGKTGTTTAANDRWFVGYTPYYTAAVWLGYDYQEAIPTNSNYNGTILWRKVMEPLHAGLEDKGFYTPNDLVSKTYCRDSGLLATEWCPLDPRGSREVNGTFVNGDQPTTYCTVHTPVEVCLDDPVLDANGQPIAGLYHIAGEHCPEESRQTIALLDYNRDRATESVVTRDDNYLLSTWEEKGWNEPCSVHNGEPTEPFDPYDPATWPANDPGFDPLDPHTWPVDDPNFDPDDPTTWPWTIPGTTDPGVSDPGVSDPGTTDPGTTDPGTVTDPDPGSTPEPEPSLPPGDDDEPYIPANGP